MLCILVRGEMFSEPLHKYIFNKKKVEENGCRSNSTEIKKQFSPRGNRF